APELVNLSELQTEGICSVQDEQIAFLHDLFGDWARLRVVMAHAATLSTFLPSKLDSPLWHRAIRLFGVHLLEQGDALLGWRRAFAALSKYELAQDLLLEAALFAATSG